MKKIKPRECQNIEYKSSWHDKYLEWICGFANAQGAVMYFGVNDNHEVFGLENVDRLMEDIPNKIITTMGIVADVNLHEMDGLEYIEVYVEPSNIPINYKGKYYYRSGSTMQELRGPALQQFVLKKMNITWDSKTITEATIDDIDPEAVNYFVQRAISAKRISETTLNENIEQVLRKLHLINAENGQLTIAALLLFGKDIERWNMSAAFRIGRFGNSEADLIIQDNIVCPLVMMPNRVMETLKTKYLVLPIHFEGLYRKEPLEIPEDALREMLCNSIVHKDYTGTFIQMKVYGDRITLWNGGALPPQYTVETLMTDHESHPRNKLIANVFYLAGFIESWGRGYQIIRESFQKEKLAIPIFEETRGGVLATIQREKFIAIQKGNVVSDVVSDVVSLSLVQLTDRQKEMCKLMIENPFISAQQMSVVLSVVHRTVQRDLSAMQNKGVLIREGNTSAGHWVVLTKMIAGWERNL